MAYALIQLITDEDGGIVSALEPGRNYKLMIAPVEIDPESVAWLPAVDVTMPAAPAPDPQPEPDPAPVPTPPDPAPEPAPEPTPPALPIIDFSSTTGSGTIERSRLKVGQPIGQFAGFEKAGKNWRASLDTGSGNVDNPYATVSGGRTPNLGKSVPSNKDKLFLRFELRDDKPATGTNRWDLQYVLNIV